ncbi:MAG: helix-turn-helix domain-containing protein, partial [Actinobacteria bacterium]|nr:helix-turn-helix domain-containing protein [Actinomycetota bacterium]
RLWLDVLEIDLARPEAEEAQRLAEVLWGDDVSGTPHFAPLIAGEERLGILASMTTKPFQDADNVLAAVASHAAVAIKQHQLIDSLKEKNLVKDFFEALSRGEAGDDVLSAQAARLGCDLDGPHLVLHVVPWTVRPSDAPRRGRKPKSQREPHRMTWSDLVGRIESRLSAQFRGTLFDHRERSVRALLRVEPGQPDELAEAVRRIYREVSGDEPGGLSIGLSNVCQGGGSFVQGFDEAASAAEIGALVRGGPGVATYEDLGPYKYVMLSEEGVRDRYQQRLERLAEYDRLRGTQLLETLEGYLDRRGNIVGTSRALYIHPNTLRQRLARIERVAGLDLEHEEWLSLAIAIKVVKLRRMRRSAGEEGREEDG